MIEVRDWVRIPKWDLEGTAVWVGKHSVVVEVPPRGFRVTVAKADVYVASRPQSGAKLA